MKFGLLLLLAFPLAAQTIPTAQQLHPLSVRIDHLSEGGTLLRVDQLRVVPRAGYWTVIYRRFDDLRAVKEVWSIPLPAPLARIYIMEWSSAWSKSIGPRLHSGICADCFDGAALTPPEHLW